MLASYVVTDAFSVWFILFQWYYKYIHLPDSYCLASPGAYSIFLLVTFYKAPT